MLVPRLDEVAVAVAARAKVEGPEVRGDAQRERRRREREALDARAVAAFRRPQVGHEEVVDGAAEGPEQGRGLAVRVALVGP